VCPFVAATRKVTVGTIHHLNPIFSLSSQPIRTKSHPFAREFTARNNGRDFIENSRAFYEISCPEVGREAHLHGCFSRPDLYSLTPQFLPEYSIKSNETNFIRNIISYPAHRKKFRPERWIVERGIGLRIRSRSTQWNRASGRQSGCRAGGIVRAQRHRASDMRGSNGPQAGCSHAWVPIRERGRRANQGAPRRG
jgi:hypothetical protein